MCFGELELPELTFMDTRLRILLIFDYKFNTFMHFLVFELLLMLLTFHIYSLFKYIYMLNRFLIGEVRV